ncbi:MAG: FUSC family protein [Agrococcus casei]|uniref:FUSC family protein n=1 Tax=Agrococcus casei TaxID=343512 RepID=UPI003F9224A2
MRGSRVPARLRSLADTVRAQRRVSPLQMLKTSIAAVLSWMVAGLLPSDQPPIFAVIAAIIIVAPSVNQSLAKVFERTLGVLLGVVLAMGIGLLFGEGTWVILLAVVVSVVVAWALRLSVAAGNQLPISAMLVLALGAASPTYSVERIVETVIGAIIAFVINALIVPPVPLEDTKREILTLAEETARSFERLADASIGRKGSEKPGLLLVEVRLLRPMQERADEAVLAAEESLALNPFARRYRPRISAMRDSLDELAHITVPLIGMTRAFRDHYDDELTSEPMMREIAIEMRRIAHDIRMRFVTPHEIGPEESVDTKPLLTTPLIMAAPSGVHWMLIGSLLEDLRRVHGVVVGEDER